MVWQLINNNKSMAQLILFLLKREFKVIVCIKFSIFINLNRMTFISGIYIHNVGTTYHIEDGMYLKVFFLHEE